MESPGLVLVEEGEARVVIIVSGEITELQREAVEDFVAAVERATDVALPVLPAARRDAVASEFGQIILGPSPLTERLLPGSSRLEPEEYRIVSAGNTLLVLAVDLERHQKRRSSRVTSWALGFLLEHHVGVRWLWPGELGTVVPRAGRLEIPEMDFRYQPSLLERRFGRAESAEAQAWMGHVLHSGARKEFSFKHSFRAVGPNGDWYGRFHETRPDMLARNPAGEVEAINGLTDRIKLCVSNPDVVEEIVRIWRSAGAPDFWDVTPNDGKGFCTCDGCMRLDEQYGGGSFSKEDVWNSRSGVSLSGRYVWFWNRLVRRMRQFNPDVEIGVFFYSNYRDPPKKLKVDPGVAGLIVHDMDFAHWRAWQSAGATKIGLRPNWWYMGASAPFVPLHKVGAYVEQAREAGMFMIYMDSLHEFWATQGPNYYLVARLIADPSLTTEAVIDEYCSAFGTAAGIVREYLDYWEAFGRKVGFNVPAGGAVDTDPEGLYTRVSTEHFGSALHPLRGHWENMPFLYTEPVLEKGESILERARRAAGGDALTLRRIEFLRDGLEQVRITTRLMLLPKSERGDAIGELIQFQREMEEKYGYWGLTGVHMMKAFGVIGKDVDLEGL